MGSRSRPWTRLQRSVRRHQRIDIMLQLLETALVDWRGPFQIHQYAWSLEMCTRSWADQSEVARVQAASAPSISSEVLGKSAGEVNVRWKSWAQGPMFEPGLVLRGVL